ncbi:enzymatic polyprotein endonuclease reverse-like protein, partial [Leptotrombidium deliense]
HNSSLISVLSELREAKLKLKPNKCFFGYTEIKYLGYVISADGIRIDPAKIAVLENIKPPKNLKELRRILGGINYLKNHISKLSHIAQPLYCLLKKDACLIWTHIHDAALKQLIKQISEAPVLTFSKPNCKKILCCDASENAIGGVLKQEECDESGKQILRIIGYYGRSLSESEKKYPVFDKEFLAIFACILHWRCDLYGVYFHVYTDHKPISVAKDRSKSASLRMRRWILQLYEYTFEIIYKEGRINFDADFLSRLEYKDDEKDQEEIIAFAITQENLDISLLQSADVFCTTKIQELKNNSKAENIFGEQFALVNDILYRL